MTSTRDLFSPDDPGDLFVLSMSMARNDIRHALNLVGKANADDQPEFGYLLRVALGHFFDGAHALRMWRQESPEARALLAQLPTDGQDVLKKVMGTDQQLGNGALEHNRVSTFHYPSPDPVYKGGSSVAALADALRQLGDDPASITVTADGSHFRFSFADDVAMALATQKFDLANTDGFRAQQDRAMEGATAFVNLVDLLWPVFMRERRLGLDAD